MIGIGELRSLKRLVRRYYPSEALWLFGSYAEGTARQTSDLDIFIDDSLPTDLAKLGALRDAVSKTGIPLVVDLVLASTTDASFRESALRNAKSLDALVADPSMFAKP